MLQSLLYIFECRVVGVGRCNLQRPKGGGGGGENIKKRQHHKIT